MTRLLNWKIKEADLQTASDEELVQLEKWIAKEQSRRKFWTRLQVAVEAVNTGDEYFKAAGLAMLHLIRMEAESLKPHQWKKIVNATSIQLPEDFSAKKHASHLAKMAHKYHDRNTGATGDEEAAKFYQQVCLHFRESDFVFGLTNYDECDNGHYFRRS